MDPETSEVIRRIFAWRSPGLGFRAIASLLTDEGISCPSAADRERNPHRLGRAWSVSAVRAIVLNPKYKGQATYGRYHKVDRLRSVDNPAAGHVTREVPSGPNGVLAIDGAIDPIVTEAEWDAAQPGVSPSQPGPRPERLTSLDAAHPGQASRYALRGLLICADCGRKMQGNMVSRKRAEPRVGYRCLYREEYPRDTSHPRSLFVAEDRIVPALDDWLATLTSQSIDETVAAMLAQAGADDGEPPEVRRARMIAEEARTKLDRYMDAIEKGMDPTLYVERSRVAQQELAAAKAVIEGHTATAGPILGEREIRDLLERVGSIVGLLRHADARERQVFYRELGLNLAYQRVGDQDKVRAHLGVEFSRVGGGT
ncbi:MAG: recombinase family protein [Acidimicrobiales bacterium]